MRNQQSICELLLKLGAAHHRVDPRITQYVSNYTIMLSQDLNRDHGPSNFF